MTYCNRCNYAIDFQYTDNRCIPVDSGTDRPHRCEKRVWLNCFKCAEYIIFVDDIRSKSGMMIPLDVDLRPHRCGGR